MKRIGTPTSEKEGVVLEMYGDSRKVVLRGWHTGCLTIKPIHISIEEFAHKLGLIVPPRKRG